MKTKLQSLLVTLALFAGVHQLSAQGTAFTYQGRLNNGNAVASGNYDFTVALYNDPLAGSQVGVAETNSAVAVTNGLFTTTIDFGATPLNGQPLWLQILVRTNGNGAFTTLAPRQPLTSAPYAVQSLNAGSASSVAAANLNGTILNSSLPSSPSFSGTVTASSFSGNGANVTNVNAASLGGLNATNFWQTGGNNVATGQFLGSTNNQPLEIRVGGLRAGLFSPSNNIVFGAAQNVISNTTVASSILGGINNSITTNLGYSVIGGGSGNSIVNHNAYLSNLGFSVIGGGTLNSLESSASYSVIGGGNQNSIQILAGSSFVGGGQNNVIQTNAGSSVIGGGQFNIINAAQSVIGGGNGNVIEPGIQGGGGSVIVGGESNAITNANASAIVGGSGNMIQNDAIFSFIGGGSVNIITPFASASVIGGGVENSIAGGIGSVIGGGEYNVILPSTSYNVIGGGVNNTNGSHFSVVPGGEYNYAGGYYSFAAGQRAKANFQGDFVWADSQAADFNSGNNDEFLIRAQGGVGINKTNPVTALDVLGTVTATGFSGNGSGLTNINFSQLTGTVPATQLPAGIVTNNESGVTLSNLTVNGGLTLPSATIYSYFNILGNISTNRILLADGNLNFFAGQLAGSLITSGSYNTGIGDFALLANTTGSYNTANGGGAMAANTGGSNNVAVGYEALENNTNDSELVAIGYQALQNDRANTLPQTFSGYGENTAIGFQSLFKDTLGAANTAIGFTALYNNVSGNHNTATGDNALQYNQSSDNTAIGYDTLQVNTTGSGNTALGLQALTSNQTGANNTAVGYQAMLNATNDNEVVAIGYQALLNDAAQGQGSMSGNGENTAVGNSALKNDTVGIGNTAVGYDALNTTTGVQGNQNTAIGSYALANLGQPGNNNIAVGNFAGYFLNSGNNNIYIGNIGPNSVESATVRIGDPTLQTATYLAGTVYANGVALTSDRNTKENFRPVDNQSVLAKVAALPVTEWNYKTDKAGVQHIGPMAQDFQAAFKLDGADDKHISVVDEGGVALAAIQGLNQKLNERDAEIQTLKQQNDSLAERLNELEAMVKQLAAQK
jgi:hypothetical protein